MSCFFEIDGHRLPIPDGHSVCTATRSNYDESCPPDFRYQEGDQHYYAGKWLPVDQKKVGKSFSTDFILRKGKV